MKRNRDRVRKEEAGRIAAQLHLDDEPVEVDLDEDERVEIASLSSDLDHKAYKKVIIPLSTHAWMKCTDSR